MEKILVVDDVAINRKILCEILKDSYEVYEACDGESALAFAHEHASELSIILLDILMPKFDGYEVLKVLKSDRTTQHIPVILISSLDSEDDESRGLKEGAIDYITRPFNAEIVRCRVHNHVELKQYQDRLQELVDQRAKKILKMRESVFDAVTSIIEYRNLESGMHVKRLRLYCEAQLDFLLDHRMYTQELDSSNASLIARASSLHDIGKVSIPDHILTKPGKLTEAEFEVMKTHTTIGSDFIDSLNNTDDEEYIHYSRQICRHHHERWDGTGYPDALRGEEIPIAARIVSVADVYDALVSRRVYKPAFSHGQAVAIMLEGKGTQFDPTLLDVFEQLTDTFKRISAANCD